MNTKLIILAIFAILMMGCNEANDSTPLTITTTNNTEMSNALLTSFGDEKAIYIDQNKKVTIISKFGDILAQTDLDAAKPIETSASWKTSIPAHDNDTLYASAEFIDDMIYYTYHIEKGRTYGMKPYLGLGVKLVDLPCQSGWIGDVDDKKYYSCRGKVKASLSIWKKVLPSYSLSLGTTITETIEAGKKAGVQFYSAAKERHDADVKRLKEEAEKRKDDYFGRMGFLDDISKFKGRLSEEEAKAIANEVFGGKQ